MNNQLNPYEMEAIERQRNRNLNFKKNAVITMSLYKFIEVLLTKSVGPQYRFSEFYKLVESFGLVIHDNDENVVDSKSLLEILRKRGKKWWGKEWLKNRDDMSIGFWTGLEKEHDYTIKRADLEKAYRNAGKKDYPWFDSDGEYFHNPINEIQSNDGAPNQQAEAVADGGAVSIEHDTTKPRKKLIPKQRDTNECLILIYQIAERYNVKYRDELCGPEAWGKIISEDFTSTLIKSIIDNNKIELNGDGVIFKENFLEKYRKRFK